MSGGSLPPSVAPIVEDLKRIFLAGLTVVAILVVAIVVTAVLISGLFPASDLAGSNQTEPTRLATWLSLLGFQGFAVVFLVLLISKRAPNGVMFRLALGAPRVGPAEIVKLFVFSAALLGLLSFLSFTFFRDDVLKDLAVFREIMAGVPLVVPLMALAIGAPLSEELLFRAYFLGELSQTRLGFMGGSVLAALGWTLLHVGYSTVGLFEVFAAGLVFSWVLWRTGSIWVPIAFHAIYNVIVLLLILHSFPTAAQ